ncbi:hypothetical protein HNR06_004442 [Nocardiopsis arvandica]|uniref:Uncharacterized protein n=1 Tax=Nocardiopsis sinuspersici TaxID=501010 RepID=A0A7Y9XHY1_9ACTN|nr:hypothetical protein [Nocardiopsis sinuspersici]
MGHEQGKLIGDGLRPVGGVFRRWRSHRCRSRER